MKYPVSGSASFKYTVHFNDCIVSPIFKESEPSVTRLQFVMGGVLSKVYILRHLIWNKEFLHGAIKMETENEVSVDNGRDDISGL